MTKTRAVCACLFGGFVSVNRLLEGRSAARYSTGPLNLTAGAEMTTRKTRSTRTQKKTDTGSGLPSPPSSTGDGKPGDHNAAGPSSAMISPPPGENGDHRSKVRRLLFI